MRIHLTVVTCLVGTLAGVLGAPSGSAVTKPQGGTLALASGSGAPGVSVGLRGGFPVDDRVRVELQRLEGSGFVTVKVAKSDAFGRFSFTTSVPDDRATASYRVSTKGMVTPTRTVVAGTTTRLTQDPDQTKEPIERIGAYVGSMSADGRYVAYVTAGFGCCTDPLSFGAVFVWDRETLTTTRVTPEGAPTSSGPLMSGDGRYLAYTRNARWGRTSSTGDVLVWDRVTGSTVEVTSNNEGSFATSISGDGRFVAFTSVSPDLVADDTNEQMDLFIWDRQSGTVRRIDAGKGVTSGADISADGRWVTFTSEANDLVAHDDNKHADVFVWNTRTGKTRRVTSGDTVNREASLSADGRFVAYLTSDFDPEHPYDRRHADVYVWDRATGKRIRVTAVTDNTSSPMISADGKHVVYRSHSTVLAPDDASGRQSDVFVWDRRTRTTTRVVNFLNSRGPVISGDGNHIAYNNGDLDGINGPEDVYLWDRAVAPAAISASSVFSTAASDAGASEAELCFGQVPTIVGVPGQSLHGTAGPDVVVTNGAYNRVNTLGGDDLVCVRGASDALDGNGFIRTGAGDDRVDASQAVTTYLTYLDAGSDVYLGSPGFDFVVGGEGVGCCDDAPDVINTAGGNDFVHLSGPDVVDLGTGADGLSAHGDIAGAVFAGGGGKDSLGFALLRLVGHDSWTIHNRRGQLLRGTEPVASWTGFTHFDLAARGPVAFIGTALSETVQVRTNWLPRWPLDVRLRGGDDVFAFYGAAPDSRFDGGPGTDEVRYNVADSLWLSVVLADLAKGVLRDVRSPDGVVTTRRVLNFEDAAIRNDGDSSGRVVLKGSYGPNTLDGHSNGGSHIMGRASNDILDGTWREDVLLGGEGHDVARGRRGIDRCGAEVRKHCEL